MKRLSDDPAVRLAECRGDVRDKIRNVFETLENESSASNVAFDETAERLKFEECFTLTTGVVYGSIGGYQSSNGRSIELTDANDMALRLQGWLACAKSRTEQSK